MLNRKWRQKNRYRIHHRTGHHCHDRGKPRTHQTDECLLLPLGICGSPRWKNVQNNRETPDKLQKIALRLLEEISMLGTECTSVGKHTHSRGDWMKHSLMLQNLQHSTRCTERILENKRPTNPKRKWEANRLHHNQEKTPEIQQRCRSQRHDPHGQWPQMCHGNMKKDGHCKIKKSGSTQQNTTEGIKLEETFGMRCLSSKKDTKRSLKIRGKAEAANKELSQSNEKPSKQKKSSSTCKKWENRSGSKRSRWRGVLRNRGEERCGDGYRVTCRTRHGREKEDRHLEWRGLPWRRGYDGVQARRDEWKADWKRGRKQVVLVKNFLGIARERTKRHVLSCYMSATTWMRKKRSTDWVFAARMRSWWNSGKKKQMKQQQQQKKHLNPMRRSQRKTWKSEDISRREEPHPKWRNNDWKKWANKEKTGTRKERKDRKRFNEYSKTLKGFRTSQESNLQK